MIVTDMCVTKISRSSKKSRYSNFDLANRIMWRGRKLLGHVISRYRSGGLAWKEQRQADWSRLVGTSVIMYMSRIHT